MIAAMNAVEVMSLFVDDLPAARTFYTQVFAHEIVYEDDVCAMMRIGNIVINLLMVENGSELVTPLTPAGPNAGPRVVYTVNVKDTDAVCADLAALGIPLLNGPEDKPWGRRTAAFADPSGHVWEVAQEL